MAYVTRICKKSGLMWKQYRTTDKCPCNQCKKPANLKLKTVYKIPKQSEKRKKLNKPYETIKIEVLSEAKFRCFIDGCNNVATTMEHLMGRKGYADEWARENDIPLLIDKRYLRACCVTCNGELETNPKLAKKYQYSKISGIKKSDL